MYTPLVTAPTPRSVDEALLARIADSLGEEAPPPDSEDRAAYLAHLEEHHPALASLLFEEPDVPSPPRPPLRTKLRLLTATLSRKLWWRESTLGDLVLNKRRAPAVLALGLTVLFGGYTWAYFLKDPEVEVIVKPTAPDKDTSVDVADLPRRKTAPINTFAKPTPSDVAKESTNRPPTPFEEAPKRDKAAPRNAPTPPPVVTETPRALTPIVVPDPPEDIPTSAARPRVATPDATSRVPSNERTPRQQTPPPLTEASSSPIIVPPIEEPVVPKPPRADAVPSVDERPPVPTGAFGSGTDTSPLAPPRRAAKPSPIVVPSMQRQEHETVVPPAVSARLPVPKPLQVAPTPPSSEAVLEVPVKPVSLQPPQEAASPAQTTESKSANDAPFGSATEASGSDEGTVRAGVVYSAPAGTAAIPGGIVYAGAPSASSEARDAISEPTPSTSDVRAERATLLASVDVPTGEEVSVIAASSEDLWIGVATTNAGRVEVRFDRVVRRGAVEAARGVAFDEAGLLGLTGTRRVLAPGEVERARHANALALDEALRKVGVERSVVMPPLDVAPVEAPDATTRLEQGKVILVMAPPGS